MKLSLNLITLALLSVSANAMASYGLDRVNTHKVDFNKWQCKNCNANEDGSGVIGATLSLADSDDIHAANRFNGNSDGAALALNADVNYRQLGLFSHFSADNLGSEHGVAHLQAGYNQLARVYVDYAHFSQYEAMVLSPYLNSGAALVNTGSLVEQELGVQRERFAAGITSELGMVQPYFKWQTEQRSGSRSASIGGITVTNLLAPVDATSSRYTAGVNLNGDNWFTGVSYQFSEYQNNLGTALHLDGYQNALTHLPSNQAYQLMLNGAYQFGYSNIAARVVSGKAEQDTQLVPNPVYQGFSGEIQTLDINLDYSTLIGSGLRVKAGLDYADRDNQSTVFGHNQAFALDAVTGEVEAIVLLDTATTRANIGGSYRIASGYRLNADYQFTQKLREAEAWGEEQTQEHGVELKLNITEFELWDIAVKGGYSFREQSQMQADELVSDEDNRLLRRYHLADRSRFMGELSVSYTPIVSLALDLDAYWAMDDYSNTRIGLTQGEDYALDLGMSYAFYDARFYSSAGWQRVQTQQAGSSNASAANWSAEIQDEFWYLGVGADYQISTSMSLGLEYQFSDSVSDTRVVQGLNVPYGDYAMTQQSVIIYGDYALNDKTKLRLEYQYEGLDETDYAEIAPNSLTQLLTLGNLGHDYDAHQLSLTVSYKL